MSEIDNLNLQINDLKKEIVCLETRNNKLWNDEFNTGLNYHKTSIKYIDCLSTFKTVIIRCKLLTQTIKNIRLEYEHDNNREFSTKLLMLLEHYKDDIKDEMNKEKNEDIIKIMNSVFRFS